MYLTLAKHTGWGWPKNAMDPNNYSIQLQKVHFCKILSIKYLCKTLLVVKPVFRDTPIRGHLVIRGHFSEYLRNLWPIVLHRGIPWIQVLLYRGVPWRQVLLYLGVPWRQVSLYRGVPWKWVLLYRGVPWKQILLYRGVPWRQVLLYRGVPRRQVLLYRGVPGFYCIEVSPEDRFYCIEVSHEHDEDRFTV